MNYLEVKQLFTGILNRRDITATQITNFIQMGIQKAQRKLRLPPMEKTIIIECDGTKTIPVPGDYLEMIALFCDDDNSDHNKLVKRDLQTVLKSAAHSGSPTDYCRADSVFVIGPVPGDGTQLFMNYYADSTALSADTDENWMTGASPALIAYSALTYAGDFFLDERLSLFEKRFGDELADLQDMADRDELTNASMSPVH